jgi:hypothetical protein
LFPGRAVCGGVDGRQAAIRAAPPGVDRPTSGGILITLRALLRQA